MDHFRYFGECHLAIWRNERRKQREGLVYLVLLLTLDKDCLCLNSGTKGRIVLAFRKQLTVSLSFSFIVLHQGHVQGKLSKKISLVLSECVPVVSEI